MEEIVKGIKWSFDVKDGEAMLTRVPCNASGDIEIPAKLGGAKVSCVRHGAFEGCSKLKSVTIPDGLTELVEGFSMSSIEMSNRLFMDCCCLCAINVSEKNPAYKSVNGLLLTKGGEKVLAVPYGLMNVEIPCGVTKIGTSAFEGCSKLTSVTIPDGVLEIEWDAFNGCKALESVVIPDATKIIRSDAFAGCSSLKRIIIPAGVKKIEERAFAMCSGLCEFEVDKRNKKFKSVDGFLLEKDAEIHDDYSGKRRAGYTTLVSAPGGLKSATVPDCVTHIDFYAFYGCSKLKNVIIPASVTCIDFKAFYGCTALVDMTIPDSVTELGGGAFRECRKLKNLTIPASIKKIGTSPFSRSKIENVTFLPGVKSIYKDMFYNCCIKSLTLPDSLASIGPRAFYASSGLESVTIPRKVSKIGDYAFFSSDLKTVTMPARLKSKGVGRDAFPKDVKIKYVK